MPAGTNQGGPDKVPVRAPPQPATVPVQQQRAHKHGTRRQIHAETIGYTCCCRSVTAVRGAHHAMWRVQLVVIWWWLLVFLRCASRRVSLLIRCNI